MQLFLQIVGGIIVGVLLSAILLYFLVKFWLRRTFQRFAEMAEGAVKGIAPFVQPLRISLTRERGLEWNDPQALDRVVQPLLAAGFDDAGEFAVEEVPDLRLRALAQPKESVYAVVYEQAENGVWFDLVSRYADGRVLTYTTARPTGLDQMPNKTTERFEPQIDAAELYRRHLASRPAGALAPASARAFKADFERAYAEEMDWRYGRGGFTEGEIRKTLQLLGNEPTAEQVEQVHAIQLSQVGQWLETKLKEGFRSKSNMSERKWRECEHRLLFVHDRLSGDEVHELFTHLLDWDDDDAQEAADQAEMLKDGPPRLMFARMIPLLPKGRLPKKLGHVTEPVAADVYLGPEDRDAWED